MKTGSRIAGFGKFQWFAVHTGNAMKTDIWSNLLAAITRHNVMENTRLHVAFERQAIVRGSIFRPFEV
ncbi:MAG TPA: hypothetical protein DEB39_04345 [Planctomycetaceae bacterium]|nr:hypothetical protein [Planctomycetaceae bacterium]